MDTLNDPFVHKSIALAMLAAVLYLVVRVIPGYNASRQKDLDRAWAALESQREEFLASLERAESRWGQAVEKICERLEKIEERLSSKGENSCVQATRPANSG